MGESSQMDKWDPCPNAVFPANKSFRVKLKWLEKKEELHAEISVSWGWSDSTMGSELALQELALSTFGCSIPPHQKERKETWEDGREGGRGEISVGLKDFQNAKILFSFQQW